MKKLISSAIFILQLLISTNSVFADQSAPLQDNHVVIQVDNQIDSQIIALPDQNRLNLIPVTIFFDEQSVISTQRDWLRLGLIQKVRNGLRDAGLNPVLRGNYLVRSVIVMAKSARGQGQIRLCYIECPDLDSSPCSEISNYRLSNYPEDFNNSYFWLTLPLFAGARTEALLDYPIEVEIMGHVKLKNITVILEPIYGNGGGPNPNPPVIIDPIHNPPPFLVGKTVIYNSGRIQIGEDKNLGRSKRITELTVGNRNTIFADYNWIDILSLKNNSIVERIVLNCRDYQGYQFTEEIRDNQGHVLNGLYVHQNTSLAFPLPRECKYVDTVQIFGSSPERLDSSAVIRVELY